MRKLFDTDFVIYDKANDHVLQDLQGKILIFGNKNEADDDCRGNETVIQCTKLSEYWKDILLNQVNT